MHIFCILTPFHFLNFSDPEFINLSSHFIKTKRISCSLGVVPDFLSFSIILTPRSLVWRPLFSCTLFLTTFNFERYTCQSSQSCSNVFHLDVKHLYVYLMHFLLNRFFPNGDAVASASDDATVKLKLFKPTVH